MVLALGSIAHAAVLYAFRCLVAEDIPAEALRSKDARKTIPILHGALLKNEQDVHLFERLVFLDKRNAR